MMIDCATKLCTYFRCFFSFLPWIKLFTLFRLNLPFLTDELFKEIQPLIRSVMDGYNVCILAYGQTGSGKTHTMVGTADVCYVCLNFAEHNTVININDLLLKFYVLSSSSFHESFFFSMVHQVSQKRRWASTSLL